MSLLRTSIVLNQALLTACCTGTWSRTTKHVLNLLATLTIATLITGTSACHNDPVHHHNIRIGFSLESLRHERWHRDLEVFTQRSQELGAEVLVQSADGNDALQVRQAENLFTEGVDVLVIVPHNGKIAASIVDSASRQHVPVMAYDRMIRNSDLTFYMSFDNIKIGEQQAQYLLSRAPKGNYVLIGGASTDENAQLLREGQMRVLKPALDRGDIKVVADQWAKDWLPSEALRHTENALTQAKNNIVAVVASNDSTAGGVVQALEEQKLAGKVLVSGQDADLAACQRIAEGTQSMTIYKPSAVLARRAAEIAVALAKHETVMPSAKVNNGAKDVPSILVESLVINRDNLAQIVAKDKFVNLVDVYRNVPKDQWPNTDRK